MGCDADEAAGTVGMTRHYEETNVHDTDMIKAMGAEMVRVLNACRGDRAQEEAMEAFGSIFTVVHDVRHP